MIINTILKSNFLYKVALFLLFTFTKVFAQKEQNIWFLGISAKIDFNTHIPKVTYDSVETYVNSLSGYYLYKKSALCYPNGKLKAIYLNTFNNNKGIYNKYIKLQFKDSLVQWLYPNTNKKEDFVKLYTNSISRIQNLNNKFSIKNTINFSPYINNPILSSGIAEICKFKSNYKIFFLKNDISIYTSLNDSIGIIDDNGEKITSPFYFSSSFGFEKDKVRIGFNGDTIISIRNIKISPNSQLLAINVISSKDSIVNDITYKPSKSKLCILKFDSINNLLSEYISLETKSIGIIKYDFSPDNKSIFYYEPIFQSGNTLKKLTWEGGIKIEDVAYSGSNRSFYDIRLAPNGKIYLSYNYINIGINSTLGVINYPNRDACCVCFQPDGLSLLSDQNFLISLPNIFKTPPYPPIQDSIAGAAVVCPSAKEVPYLIVPDSNYTQYRWSVAGGSILKTSPRSDSVFINWGNSNPLASVSLIRTHQLGCSDTTVFPVKIDTILKSQTPVGPTEICTYFPSNPLQYQINPTPQSSYTWQVSNGLILNGQGSNSVNIKFNQMGISKISISEQTNTATNLCYGSSDTLIVNVNPLPLKNSLLADFEVCQFAPLELKLKYQNPNSSYQWQSNNTTFVDSTRFSFSFTFNNDNPFPIKITETNIYDCQAIVVDTTIQPKAIDQCLFFPNIFTPNGDNANDAFVIKGAEQFPDNTLTIYNRWGTEVYKKDHYLNQWNAQYLEDGLYYYLFEIPNFHKTFKSWVMVVR